MAGLPCSHAARAFAIVSLLASSARADDFWSRAHDRTRLRAEVSFGVLAQQILAYGRRFDLATASGTTYTLDGAKFGAIPELAANLAVRIHWVGPVYAGLETFFGGVDVPDVLVKRTAVFVPGGLRFAIGGSGTVGVELLRSRIVETALEANVGVRSFTFFLEHESATDTFGRREAYIEPVIEPRVRIDFWIARKITLGVWAGSNLVEPGEAGFGLAFTVHVGDSRPGTR